MSSDHTPDQPTPAGSVTPSRQVRISESDAKDAYRAVIWVRNGMTAGSPLWTVWDEIARRIAAASEAAGAAPPRSLPRDPRLFAEQPRKKPR